jgi:hypothetical protein
MLAPNNTLDDIAAVIGFTAALHLAAWFGGGNNLFIPEKVDEEHFLARLIGLRNAQKLVDEWGNEHISVPSMNTYNELLKKKQIGRLFEMGFGSREIAGQFRMTERRVQQICRELEAKGLIAVVGPVIAQMRKEREVLEKISPSIIAQRVRPHGKKAAAKRR